MPLISSPFCHSIQLAGKHLKRAQILAIRINFKQLQTYWVTIRLRPQSLFQDFFRLSVAPISNVDICFSDRIDFIGIELAGGRCKTGIEDAIVGIYALAAGRAKK